MRERERERERERGREGERERKSLYISVRVCMILWYGKNLILSLVEKDVRD